MTVRYLYQKMAKIQIVLAFGIVTFIIMFIIFPALDTVRPQGSPGYIAFQLAFSKAAFNSIISQWGMNAVQHYVNTLWIDYIYAIVYSIFLSSFIALLTIKLYKKPTKWHIILFILPIVAGFLDWIENTLHIVLLTDISKSSASLIILSSIISSIKWSLAFFSIIIILYYIFKKTKMSRVKSPIL